MNKRICVALILVAAFGFSCLSGNLAGIWESQPDENGKFKRYHFSELNEFEIESCRLKKAEAKAEPQAEDNLLRLILIYLLKQATGEKSGPAESAEETRAKEENERCVEIMKGEYKVTKYCDTTVNCILQPQHKLTLNPKGGLRGVLAKLAGPTELEFVRKGRKLTLGDEVLTKVKGKKFDWRDYF